MIINTVSASGGESENTHGFDNSTTVFNQDGSVTETLDDCIIQTTVNSNGSITELLKDLNGTVLKTKQVTFTSNGVVETVT